MWFLRKDRETIIQTGTFLLTFNPPELPESVNGAYHRRKIRPYYPPLLRCFKWQKFGHASVRYTQKDETCFLGHPKHESLLCPKPQKFSNCGLDQRFLNCVPWNSGIPWRSLRGSAKVTCFFFYNIQGNNIKKSNTNLTEQLNSTY